MPKEYQPIEYYLEKVGNPKSYQELLEDYAKVLSKLNKYEQSYIDNDLGKAGYISVPKKS